MLVHGVLAGKAAGRNGGHLAVRVSLIRPDGVRVAVTSPSYDMRGNYPAVGLVDSEELAAVVLQEWWGLRLPESLVEAGEHLDVTRYDANVVATPPVPTTPR